MLELWKTSTVGQFEAALCTLNRCVEACPDAAWDEPVANRKFCQVVFHTLFCADCYLGESEHVLKDQDFHREHAGYFRDYEEMEDRKPVLQYDRPTTRAYLAHCRAKLHEVVAAETEQTLAARCGFHWLEISRMEVYPYNLRHIQHHAAQLSLRLRLDAETDVRWVKSGWTA